MDPITQQQALAAAGAGGDSVYVDDVFSTFLYDGTGSAQTITNGIDLSGEGGLVWLKSRGNSNGWRMVDTVRGATKALESYDTTAEATESSGLTAFTSTGFSVGTQTHYNGSSYDMASFTFRKCPGFFDVVTYTGNGSASGQTISHDLGSAPGSIWIKRTSAAEDWCVYHRPVGTAGHVRLNKTANYITNEKFDNVTSTSFDIVDADVMINGNGDSYVAYIFAHDNQSFGDDGDEAIIKCGTYTGNGGTQSINIGFEPQFLITKRTDDIGHWMIHDVMRKFGATGTNEAASLRANSSVAEAANAARQHVNATGFDFDNEGSGDVNASGGSYIYIAIRRPHKPPEAATECFDIQQTTGNNVDGRHIAGTSGSSPTDLHFIKRVNDAGEPAYISSRLQGNLTVKAAANEAGVNSVFGSSLNPYDVMNGIKVGQDGGMNASSNTYVSHFFSRKPGFMDVVTYTGNGVQGRNISHNLGVAPELMIVKNTDSLSDFHTYVSGITHLSVYGSDPDSYGNNPARLYLNSDSDATFSASGSWDHTHPTATNFRVGDTFGTNGNGNVIVAYLFASLEGISKVGSYSGNGSTQDIDCGFTNGARFVLIKRTDSADNWHLFDTTQGINSGNDPYYRLDLTAAQVTGNDFIDPLNSGFKLVTNDGAINASGGSYIFFAIA